MTTPANSRRDRTKLVALGLAGLTATLLSGAVYGRFTQRWGPPVDMHAAAERVAKMPHQIGQWQLQQERPMSDAVLETLQCAGYVNRSYVHQSTGQEVQVALYVGPPGPISVHTPEICYSSRAFEIIEQQKTWPFKPQAGPAHWFWWSTFQSRDAGSQKMRVYYAWSRGDEWTASRYPRFEFGGSRFLYKIQLSTFVGTSKDEGSSDSCQRFLEAFLQEYWRSPNS
jgi:hypothetical protein